MPMYPYKVFLKQVIHNFCVKTNLLVLPSKNRNCIHSVGDLYMAHVFIDSTSV